VGHIFINHRRALSETDAEVLFLHLKAHFPEKRLFIDRRGLDSSPDWKKKLKESVAASDVMVVVVGDGPAETWLDVTYPAGHDRAGQRRLEDPEDLVPYEIVEAIDRGIPLVPVLVNGTPMPKRGPTLPLDLWPLTKPQALFLRTKGGVKPEIDVAEIAKVIKARLAERGRAARSLKRVAAGVGVLALPVGALIGFGAADYIGPRGAMADLERQVRAAESRATTEVARAASLDATAKDLRLRLDKVVGDLAEAEKAAGAPSKALTDARAEITRLTTAREATWAEAIEARTKLAAAEKAASNASARIKDLEKELDDACAEAGQRPAVCERLANAKSQARAIVAGLGHRLITYRSKAARRRA
jgi:hypothetical protein